MSDNNGSAQVAGDGGTPTRVSGMTGLGVDRLGVGSNRVDTDDSKPCVTDISDAPGASRLNPNALGVGGGNHAGEVPGRTTACQLMPRASIPRLSHQDGGPRAVHPRVVSGASPHRCHGH
jgi:hypothetical protein